KTSNMLPIFRCQSVFARSDVQVSDVHVSDISMSLIRTKKPPTEVGGAVLKSRLTADLACRPGLDHLAGRLAQASAPADPACAGRRRPAGLLGRLDRRP